MKQIKYGQRSNLSGYSLEKRAILFTTAHLEEACLLQLIKQVMKICLVMMISSDNI